MPTSATQFSTTDPMLLHTVSSRSYPSRSPWHSCTVQWSASAGDWLPVADSIMPVLAMQAARPSAFMVAVLPPVLGPENQRKHQEHTTVHRRSTSTIMCSSPEEALPHTHKSCTACPRCMRLMKYVSEVTQFVLVTVVCHKTRDFTRADTFTQQCCGTQALQFHRHIGAPVITTTAVSGCMVTSIGRGGFNCASCSAGVSGLSSSCLSDSILASKAAASELDRRLHVTETANAQAGRRHGCCVLHKSCA